MPLDERAVVISNTCVARDTYEIELLAPVIASEGKPGQFVHAHVAPTSAPLLRRPFSIYDADPLSGKVWLLYRVRGLGTGMMACLRPGDEMDMMGPLGRGFTLPGCEHPCPALGASVLVGGGVGIAPLVYLARSLVKAGASPVVLYGASSQEDLAARGRLSDTGAPYHAATLDGSAGFRGTVVDLLESRMWSASPRRKSPGRLERSAAASPPSFIYTCGPEQMMATVAAYAQARGTPGEASLEAHMACGVGACLGCARKLKPSAHGEIGYAKICRDGPVFPLDAVEFDAAGGEEARP
ncbi:MAG: dihydroorotate dehydrogenase electron transfer subunit [Clostridia bacterium]|nr:dihydroorotate dehydrogenase electron transfer subunit [Clostridia bacterium]